MVKNGFLTISGLPEEEQPMRNRCKWNLIICKEEDKIQSIGKAEWLRRQERCSKVRAATLKYNEVSAKESVIRILRGKKKEALANPNTLYLQRWS